MPYLTFSYRIYPTPEQMAFLLATMDSCDEVYNHFLNYISDNYAEGNTTVYHREMEDILAEMRRDNPEWGKYDIHAQRDAIQRVSRAFQAFLNGTRAKPRCRHKERHTRSFTSDSNAQKIKKGMLSVPKLETLVKIKLHRPIEGVIKTMTLRIKRSGDWVVYFACDMDDISILMPSEHVRKEIGIDVGVRDFTVDSNGRHHSIPKMDKDLAKRVRREHRRLSRMQHGSENWNKQRIKLAKLYQHDAYRRHDAIHKLSTQLIAENDLIALETIDVRELSHQRHIGKHIANMGWGKFNQMLSYKGERNGKAVVHVDRYYPSSQICSVCGFQDERLKDFSITKWTCPTCSAKHDRDENAAKNIRLEGARIYDDRWDF